MKILSLIFLVSIMFTPYTFASDPDAELDPHPFQPSPPIEVDELEIDPQQGRWLYIEESLSQGLSPSPEAEEPPSIVKILEVDKFKKDNSTAKTDDGWVLGMAQATIEYSNGEKIDEELELLCKPELLSKEVGAIRCINHEDRPNQLEQGAQSLTYITYDLWHEIEKSIKRTAQFTFHLPIDEQISLVQTRSDDNFQKHQEWTADSPASDCQWGVRKGYDAKLCS